MYLPVHSVDVEGIRIPNQCPLPFLQNVVAFYLANKQVSERATLCSGNEVTHGHPDKYIYTCLFLSPKNGYTLFHCLNDNKFKLLPLTEGKSLQGQKCQFSAVCREPEHPTLPTRAPSPSTATLPFSQKLSWGKTQLFSFQANYVSSASNSGKNTTSLLPCRETLSHTWTWTAQHILSQLRQLPGFRVHAVCPWSLLHSLF